MNKKANTSLIIILIILIVIVLGIILFIIFNNLRKDKSTINNQVSDSKGDESTGNSKLSKNWIKFESEYGYSFYYPKDFIVQEEKGTDSVLSEVFIYPKETFNGNKAIKPNVDEKIYFNSSQFIHIFITGTMSTDYVAMEKFIIDTIDNDEVVLDFLMASRNSERLEQKIIKVDGNNAAYILFHDHDNNKKVSQARFINNPPSNNPNSMIVLFQIAYLADEDIYSQEIFDNFIEGFSENFADI